MRKILAGLILIGSLLAPNLAQAQCSGIFANNTVCGNSSGASAPPKQTPITSIGFPISVGTTIVAGGNASRILYDNAGILGEYVISGTGSVCMTTSCSMTTPALGTPVSGVVTNLTGIAPGITAGNVTTNANLTGVITSVGNATSIASQTGSGTKFVVDTGPTISGLTVTSSFTAAGLVANSSLANTGAWAFKGNATAGSATPTDVTIDGLTNKAVPVGADELIIADSAASFGWKKCTITNCTAAVTAGVASLGGLTGTVGVANGIETSGSNIQVTAARRTLPTKQVFLASSGTYTTPANVLWIEITLVGGGSGGVGNSAPSAAGASCWNTSGAACSTPVYSAGGGSGITGGTISGTGTCDWSVAGGSGVSQGGLSISGIGGGAGAAGGNSTLGGAGGGAAQSANGVAAAANSGSGGGGGGSNSVTNTYGAGGGGAGATCHVVINTPAGTYTYAVGAGSAGGAGGGNVAAGGAGGAGQIIVYEHYGS